MTITTHHPDGDAFVRALNAFDTERPVTSAGRVTGSEQSTATPDSPDTSEPDSEPQYPNEPGLLDNIADTLGFRGWLEKRPTLKRCYRCVVALIGILVLVTGLIMVPFPGPGWLVVIAGLAILGSEFAWAERLLGFTKRHVLSWTRWVHSQRMWARVLIGLMTAVFVYGVVVATMKLIGIPEWVPGWVPLWH